MLNFFALDSFTPLTGNVYKATIASVNCALTGADQIKKGSPLVYSVCRPPGHHAERNFLGKGFNKNFPLYPSCSDEKYLQTLNKVIKIIKYFNPKYLDISLGLDIMKGDPTESFLISPKGIKEIGVSLKKIEVPKLIVQEGGYSLTNLQNGIKNFLLGISEN